MHRLSIPNIQIVPSTRKSHSLKSPIKEDNQRLGLQNVYDILSVTVPFTKDKQFWWEVTGSTLVKMFQRRGYTDHAQLVHMLFFFVHVVPFMGPRPTSQGQPGFKSYMTDDHTPFESSWVVGANGQANVRYAIEPIDVKGDSGIPAALRMVDDLQLVIRDLDLRWFWILNDALVSHTQSAPGAKHATKYFLGFDCDHKGDTTLKAYFLPEVKSAETGIPKEQLVSDALTSLNAGLLPAWNMVTSFFDTLDEVKRPGIEIVATDCSDPAASRIKVYVRTSGTTFADVEAFMTLGGELKGKVIDDALDALVDLWNLVMGMDVSSPGWKHQRLVPRISRDVNDNHITGGLLFYYELKPGHSMPYPKIYLPVRHYCVDDLAIASGMETYHLKRGTIGLGNYLSDVQSTFGGHRSLGSRTGIHTYLTVAIKKGGFELTNYFNPESYAQERFD